MEQQKIRVRKKSAGQQTDDVLGLPASHEISAREPMTLPMIPLRGLLSFPGLSMTFDVARPKSRAAVRQALEGDQLLFLAAQIQPDMDWPLPDDIYRVGCIARIRQVFETNSSDSLKLLVEGQYRAWRTSIISEDPCYLVECSRYEPVDYEGDLESEAYRRQLLRHFETYAVSSSRISADAITAISGITDPSLAADTIVTHLNIPVSEKQRVLEMFDVKSRISMLLDILSRERLIAELEREIGEKVRLTIEKNQKEYYLREQLKVIQNELGERESAQDEQERYLELLEKTAIPEEFQGRIKKEIARLSRMQMGNPEGSVLRNYLDLVFEMPWGQVDLENLDIAHARKILDRDHYGLEPVKERILEYLAVRKLRAEAGMTTNKGPILCLVGPPGVGKTSIARSVAEALGRKYVRMSLGGIRDEAEIRGHRRTYIGAMPGRIINAIRQAGKDNPLILLDEIDKIGSDYRGDPSSALLEVLDPEQNGNFRDHYLEIPYDLSHVLFITTANTAETIPQPLLDRMELIQLSGYTEEEKLEIALRHLLPNQLQQNALKKNQLLISREGLRSLISGYTREAGVRQLERELAHLCRRAAILITEQGKKRVKVTPDNLEALIGKVRYRFEKAAVEDQVGVATGLAWTYAGGDTLMIEVNIMPGSGHLELTGQLGDVMKESAKAALSYIRTRAAALGIAADFGSKTDIHIHVPAGATPKDGPSAGITLACALASALSGRPVRHNVAMTGEITLRGRILPIGGLKEKVIAAHRAGIDTVLVPQENQRDAAEIPETILKKVNLVFVRTMDDVFAQALLPGPELQSAAFAGGQEGQT
jgi:ATP-dependent Lon protease